MLSVQYTYKLSEMVAAVGMELGASPKKWRAYHEALAPADGYTEFYRVSIWCAFALEREAARRKTQWGQQSDWVLSVEFLADAVLDFMIARKKSPSEEDLVPLACAAIEKATIVKEGPHEPTPPPQEFK